MVFWIYLQHLDLMNLIRPASTAANKYIVNPMYNGAKTRVKEVVITLANFREISMRDVVNGESMNKVIGMGVIIDNKSVFLEWKPL